ncbi:type II toxin-antitoxin system PemK/MazF family toxin [Paenibacillus oleatilyticus]|uniref:type II toxin-antitoxin system PemK/MazF family toxin n=1 Tax=Paenibacillus oleatilyticus TaxID=2594886 RepID=UPI001C1F2701|nr:type II toxin-antitoxin system PemK/MazF family toxin [Paenibacillus oleatilyticus]MBU7316095.1 type II toxin-antitoxin system PemK/MazF family toxin [Paenibacillus oleatilyticus]
MDFNHLHTEQTFRRGDICLADLSPVVGCEQGGVRPVLVIQNDIGNRYSPTVIVASISTANKNKNREKRLPTHVELLADRHGLEYDSTVLCEQLRTIDRNRIDRKLTTLDTNTMEQIDLALEVSIFN